MPPVFAIVMNAGLSGIVTVTTSPALSVTVKFSAKVASVLTLNPVRPPITGAVFR